MTPDIVLTDTPSAEDRKVLLDGLIAFNEAHIGPHGWKPLSALAKDPATGRVLGGLTGACRVTGDLSR